MRAALAVAAVALLGAGMPSLPAPRVALDFSGRWELVRHRHDGRADGASARTFHAGDAANIVWRGTMIDVYGVTGPTGGYGVLVMPDRPNLTLNFYSPVKRAHVLLYRSTPVTFGNHFAAIVTVPDHDARSRGTYVNIDEIDAH
jgi:hypothetical protein